MRPKFRPVLINVGHERAKAALRIVGDGAIATAGVGDGRMIPLVILDTSERPDLEELIRLHEFVAEGDVKTQWGKLYDHEDTVALILTFTRPAEVVAIIEFELKKNHGILIEKIFKTSALYIQAGREGDRIRHDFNRRKVIIEVPETKFKAVWSEIFFTYSVKLMRTKGFDRAEAKRQAKLFITQVREVAALRPSFSSKSHEP
jgi:hypothetical protein